MTKTLIIIIFQIQYQIYTLVTWVLFIIVTSIYYIYATKVKCYSNQTIRLQVHLF